MAEIRLGAGAVRWAIVALFLLTLELLAAVGILPPLVIPAPSDVGLALLKILPSEQFARDLERTAVEVVASCVLGISAGLVLGALGWRYRLFADAVEPYLVAMYAMPTLVFYPILLALMGLSAGPIIVISTLMVIVPVTLNTTAGLRSIPPVLVKLARSTRADGLTRLRKVLLPAAIPLLMPGMKLGVIYGMVAAIAMEFILSSRGLGYSIGYLYTGYRITDMWAYIVVVMILGMAVVSLLDLLEQRIRRDMA